MNNRVNYRLVGFLVLVGITLMLGFTYWILQPRENSEMKYYTMYFRDSVSGLNIDSPVKYKGVAVGKVKKIEIDWKNIELIKVTVSILASTPIKATTTAKLVAQGITGLSFVNLSKGTEDGKVLKRKPGEKYPVIRTKRSFLKGFEKSLRTVSSSLTSTLGRTEELLGEDNQKQIAILLQKVASIMSKLDKTLGDKTLVRIQSTIKNIDNFSAKLNSVIPNITQLLVDTKAWELSTSNSMKGITNAISSGVSDYAQMNNHVMPTINATLLDMQDLMIKMDEILEGYRTSPSDILFKSQKKKKGPGEK